MEPNSHKKKSFPKRNKSDAVDTNKNWRQECQPNYQQDKNSTKHSVVKSTKSISTWGFHASGLAKTSPVPSDENAQNWRLQCKSNDSVTEKASNKVSGTKPKSVVSKTSNLDENEYETVFKENKRIIDSELKRLASSKRYGDSFLFKLIKESTGFWNLIHERDNEPTKICLILQIVAKVATFDKTQLLNQFSVLILPSKNTTRHFMTSQLILFISNLNDYVRNKNDRQLYLDGVNNMLIFLKFLLSTVRNYAYDTVKNLVSSLAVQIAFINNQSREENIFHENVAEQLYELQTIIQDYELALNGSNQDSENKTLIKMPLNDFRNISVCPTPLDILHGDKPFLQRNMIKGKYNGVEHYLDVQFNLLREDLIRPLREGIFEYKQVLFNSVKDEQAVNVTKIENLNIYNDVNITNIVLDPDGLICEISFDVSPFRNYRWQCCKRLLIGSLICLSCDQFDTFHLASVAGKRNEDDLTEGRFYVKFEFINDYDVLVAVVANTKFIAIESPAFFEAYRHNLEILKTFNEYNFPFQKYIVDVNNEISPPSYLSKKSIYKLEKLLLPIIKHADKESSDVNKNPDRNDESQPEHKSIEVALLSDASWISANTDFGFNKSQFSAFKAALTSEFAIIQGPPGTGKTYVGLRIVQALAENLRLRHRTKPKILVVCYTNHALDQFLEGILSFCQDIIRIGGQSRNALIDACNLGSVRQEMRRNGTIPSKINKERNRTYSKMETIKSNIENLQNIFNNSVKCILDSGLRHVISEFYEDHCIVFDLKESLASWLGYELTMNTKEKQDPVDSTEKNGQNENDDLDKAEINYIESLRTIVVDSKPEDCEEVEAQEHHSIEYVATDENENDDMWIQNGESGHNKKSFQVELREVVAMNKTEALKCTELQLLDKKDRLRLYKFWLLLLHIEIDDHMEYLRTRYNFWLNNFKAIREEEDEIVVGQSKIMAMTTTGAAKYHHLIETLQPNVIVVEEAAEVLEPHIITSMCKNIEHVILIGDHQQLKPNSAVFDLAKNYKMNVSLFERMIVNDLPYYQLKEQHRMHPNISSLLVPHIYRDLKDHPSVLKYEDIKGMPSNLLFINHNAHEKKLFDSMSYMNEYEAQFSIALAHYLLLQGYRATQITILTTYTGQLLKINQHIRSHVDKRLKNILVRVVDNYQGEENDIIILSCVRSNKEGNIGFFEIPNRINVALSRAKMALYCIGDFDCLCKKSELWETIVQKVKNQRSFGNKFEVACQNHPEVKTVVEKPCDFMKMPTGGCLKPCQAILECSHLCANVCHIVDPFHKNEYKCMAQCEARCSSDHRCHKTCHWKTGDCGICETPVKVNGECGHNVKIMCGHSKDDDKILAECSSPCRMILLCGHMCKGSCGSCKQGRFHRKCYKYCDKTLSCGHVCKRLCSDNCICSLCIRIDCPHQFFKSIEKQRIEFNATVFKQWHDTGLSLKAMQSCFSNITNDMPDSYGRTTTSEETQRRKLVLSYIVKVKPMIDNFLIAETNREKLEKVLSITKFENRISDVLAYLKDLKNSNDEQGLCDLNTEISLLNVVSNALNKLLINYVSKPTTECLQAILKSTFDIIPTSGCCSKTILEHFEQDFQKVFNN